MTDIIMLCIYGLIGGLFLAPWCIYLCLSDAVWPETSNKVRLKYSFIYTLKGLAVAIVILVAYIAFYALCRAQIA